MKVIYKIFKAASIKPLLRTYANSVYPIQGCRKVWKSGGARNTVVGIMAVRVVEFSNGVYKIRKIFSLKSTYPKEIIEFWELD